MTLNEWASKQKIALLSRLQKQQMPDQGDFDEMAFREAMAKGDPQVGATVFEPNRVHFEFVFPDRATVATVLRVSMNPPERIVYMPVPEWVIETIWQGEISGCHHFESHARELLERFANQLEPEPNAALFGGEPPKRRE